MELNLLINNRGKRLPLQKAKGALSTFRATTFNNMELEQCDLPPGQPLAHAYPEHRTS